MKTFAAISLLFFLYTTVPSDAQQESFSLSPAEIDLGGLRPNQIAGQTVVIENSAALPLELALTSACPCVAIDPPSVAIPAGESVSIIVSLEADQFNGDIVRTVVITEKNSRVGPRVLRVSAHIVGEPGAVPCASCNPEPPESNPNDNQVQTDDAMIVDLYLDVGCRKCITFLEERVPELEESFARELVVHRFDVLDPDAMDLLLDRLSASGEPLSELPVAFVMGAPLQGLDGIESGLVSLLQGGAEDATVRTGGQTQESPGAYKSFSLGSVLLAGLVDGINPCAFSTILFLISMLALVGRTRREILAVGAVYTAVVFLGYFAAGLGLFVSVRSLMIFPTVTLVIRWALVVMLGVLAVLSFRDAILAARGRTRDMALQLSDGLKRRIHGVVRERVRMGSVVLGTASLAILVTVFEFSCTGQVYLPVIMHLARTADRARGLGLLVVYNLAFIVPLLVVFAAGYFGISMSRVSTFFGRHVPMVKILLALVFIGLAVMTVVV
jgi:cytochrome c biogenesis protein CcdA